MGQNVGQTPDPHRDPHREMAGKVSKAPDRKFCLPARCFCVSESLHDLLHEAAHGFRGLVLLLPGGVGVGAECESGIVVPQHGGHRLDVHAVLQGHGGEGMPISYNRDKPDFP